MAAFSITLTIIFLSTFLNSSTALPLVMHSRLRVQNSMQQFHGPLPPEQWITQRLNHFDDSNLDTWKQRYFVNDTFYKPGGPVFIMIWGESEANPLWVQNGMWIEWAQQMNAVCLLLEHRYYGKSHPTKDLSVSNLRYLSIEQALADLAYFRNYMAKNMSLPEDTKWVSFGGSYAGSLSAWFRLKYPHLVDAAVASSAPVRIQVNFDGYLEVMHDSLATSNLGDICNSNIQDATDKMELLLQDKFGWKQLTQLFRLCKPLNGSEDNDVSNFFMALVGNLMTVIQYNHNNRAWQGTPGTNITIDTVCNIMGNSSYGDNLMRYAAINSLVLDTYGEECLDVSYDEMISELKEDSWDSPSSDWGRQWMYQKCTEFGFFHTSDSDKQPFGSRFPLSFCAQQCADIFGNQFTLDRVSQGVNWTLTNYGGGGIKASKVIFPNGAIDPWHVRGILKDLSEDQVAIFMNGTAHCADIYPPSQDDLPELTAARQTIFKLLQTWLKSFFTFGYK